MLTRLALAAALASIPLPSLALAQSAPSSALCDGSEVRHAERLRRFGRGLAGGTVAVDIAALFTIPNDPSAVNVARSRFRFAAMTAPVILAGAFIADRARPGDGFWDRVIARLRVGETRSADVRLCLQRPEIMTTEGSTQRWTYIIERPTGLGRGSLRAMRLVFRDSVLARVERTEVSRSASAGWPHAPSDSHAYRRRAICIPAPTVFADPFPPPLDTSAASVAMARAQADADAATKNAANAAEYAACLASDSANGRE